MASPEASAASPPPLSPSVTPVTWPEKLRSCPQGVQGTGTQHSLSLPGSLRETTPTETPTEEERRASLEESAH